MASYSEKQDVILGQFKHALRGDQHESRNAHIERSRKRTESDNKKILAREKVKENDTTFVGGYSGRIIEDCERKQKIKLDRYLARINAAHTSELPHPLFNRLRDIFGFAERYNIETIQEQVGHTFEILTEDKVKIKVKFNRALKSSLKFTVYYEFEKPYFKKSETWSETNKEVVQAFRTETEEITGRAKYGNYFDFTDSLYRPFKQLVRELSLTQNPENVNLDIWEFKFSK